MSEPQRACRKHLCDPKGIPAHAGLLLAYGLTKHEKENVARVKLLQSAQSAARAATGIYERAFNRWVKDTPAGGGRAAAEVKTTDTGRLITGLGSESVLETGLRLHYTYGTPLLPGSGLKGLAAHYAAAVWGEKDSKWKEHEEYHRVVFGTQDDAGHARFEDGWILPESLATALQRDVMTPHHGDYYMADAADDKTAPTDFDDPIPVAYLSVKGHFRVVVEWDAEQNAAGWAALVLGLVTEALKNWGFGGKTSSGYGRMGMV